MFHPKEEIVYYLIAVKFHIPIFQKKNVIVPLKYAKKCFTWQEVQHD